MNETRSPLFNYFLPSISDFVILAFFLIWILFNFYLSNYDIWWHLRAGDLILSGGFPKVDVFSFTAAGRPWILHSWGSEVIFSLMYNMFGATGLVVLRAFVVSLTFGILFKIFLRLKVDLLLAILLVITAAEALKFHIIIRPHLFSLLFFVLILYIYTEYKMYDRRKMMYFLPVFFIVWINLHGGFIVGFIFLGLCITGETADNLMAHKMFFSFDQSKTNTLFLTCVFSFVLCLCNPNTYKGLLYPFLYRGQEAMPLNSIAEWSPTSWSEEPFFFVLVLFLITVISLSNKRLKLYQLFPILFFAFYTFRHRRIVPFFSLVMLLFIGPYLQNLIKYYYQEAISLFAPCIKSYLINFSRYFSDRSIFFTKIEKTHKYHITLAILLICISSALITGRMNSLLPLGVSWNMFPTKNIKVLKKLRLQGNIFNEYEWGGMLIKEFPDKKVFIDGRIDVYGPEIYSEYLRVLNLRTGWKNILSKYSISHILVSNRSFISSFLTKTDPNWLMVSEDKISKLFVKKTKKE